MCDTLYRQDYRGQTDNFQSVIGYLPARMMGLSDDDSSERKPVAGLSCLSAVVIYATPPELKENSGQLSMAGLQLAVPLLASRVVDSAREKSTTLLLT